MAEPLFPIKTPPSLWLALPPQINTLKSPPLLCSSKSHKHDNYDQAPVVPKSKSQGSPHLHPHTQAELTPRSLSQHTNKNTYTFSKSLTYNQANLKELCNQDISEQVIIHDITKKKHFRRLCMKCPASVLRHSVQRGFYNAIPSLYSEPYK